MTALGRFLWLSVVVGMLLQVVLGGFSSSVQLVPEKHSASLQLAAGLVSKSVSPRANDELTRASNNLVKSLEFADTAQLLVAIMSSGYNGNTLGATETAVRINATRTPQGVSWTSEKLTVKGSWTKTARQVHLGKHCTKHFLGVCTRHDDVYGTEYDAPSADEQMKGLQAMSVSLQQEMIKRGWTASSSVPIIKA
jgi:hypothetical protein